MKASDYIIQYLSYRGVTHIFEVIGGMLTHIIDSAHQHGKVKLISMHHEQAAAFAADAMGRITGVPGVAMATSGPGAVNLLTGIGSCYFDSVPTIFITGQVNRSEHKGNRKIRQLGFQETDIVAMAQPITKAAIRLIEPDQLPKILEDAFSIALSDRPGPVLLDIPMDVQRVMIKTPNEEKPSEKLVINNNIENIISLLLAVKNAKKPLILAGGGIHSSRSSNLFRQFVEVIKVPVVNSLMAVDTLSYHHPQRVGLIGSYGNRWANMALGSCDLLIVLGSRLDIRQTGADVNTFQSNRRIYHVDCEESEINNRVKGCYPILSDLALFLRTALNIAEDINFPDFTIWKEEIENNRSAWPDVNELSGSQGINPNELMHAISKVSKDAGAYVVDVGNNQMWAAQSLELEPDQHFITSGGMGAMGFSLPAAIGTSFALPNKPVVQISGDGGMQMNIQELQTIVHHRLPIKMIVLNNQSYGMVRQFQQSYFHERYASTYWGYSAPDFARVAQAYGISTASVVDEKDIAKGLEMAWENPLEPFLLQIHLDPMTNVYPKIAFGYPITQMEPFYKPKDMEGT